MICIYDKKVQKDNFNNNGLGVLNECLVAEITEELNGQYYLEIEYPINSKRAREIQEFNIIKANEQLFRIYKVEKIQEADRRLRVYANHIFYDIANYFIEDLKVENTSVKTIMQKAMVDGLSYIYSVDSDITIANTMSVNEISPLEVIFKMIKNLNQGELLRDNFNIEILKKIGNDTGVLIKYGKNIKGLKVTIDTSNVATKIYPKGENGIKLTEKYINVPNWDSDMYPPFPIIKMVEFKEVYDEVLLRQKAIELANTIGISAINIQVDFIELSKTREYEKYKDLENVKVGDIVTVSHKEFDIKFKARVIKIKRDVLTGVNTKVEIGQPLSNFIESMDPTALIKTATDELGNKVAQALTSILYYANPIQVTVTTNSIQPIYLGVSAVANTNISLSLALSCIASEECTLTIDILLDGKLISFRPKQKMVDGANVIGIPIGIPQVGAGAHYIGVTLKVDKGAITIPIYNLQCLIDGRNLQGGLSSELPHAEAKQVVKYVEVYKKVINKKADITIETPINISVLENVDMTYEWGSKVNENIEISLKET